MEGASEQGPEGPVPEEQAEVPVRKPVRKQPGRKMTCVICGPTNPPVHRIPKNEPLRGTWIEALGLQSGDVKISSRICGIHFAAGDLNPDTRMPKPEAIPKRHAVAEVEAMEEDDVRSDADMDVEAGADQGYEQPQSDNRGMIEELIKELVSGAVEISISGTHQEGCHGYLSPEQNALVRAQVEAYGYLVSWQNVPPIVYRESTNIQGEDKDAIIGSLMEDVFSLERMVSQGHQALARKDWEISRLREQLDHSAQSEQGKNEELESMRKKVKSLQTMLARKRKANTEPAASSENC